MARVPEPVPPGLTAPVESLRDPLPGEEDVPHRVFTDPVTGTELAAVPDTLPASVTATRATARAVQVSAANARAAAAAAAAAGRTP